MTGGTTPYTYDWFDVPGGSNTEDRSGLPAGAYSLVVTDANGCTANVNVTITQPPLLVAALILAVRQWRRRPAVTRAARRAAVSYVPNTRRKIVSTCLRWKPRSKLSSISASLVSRAGITTSSMSSLVDGDPISRNVTGAASEATATIRRSRRAARNRWTIAKNWYCPMKRPPRRC